MATSQTGNKEVTGDLTDIKRKLAWRMGVAGLMIIGLLGGLAIFDRLSGPGEKESSNAPQFSEPVPVAKKVQTQPVTPAEPTPEAHKVSTVIAEPESSAPPVGRSAPALEPPPPPEVTRQPVLPRPVAPVSRAAGAATQLGPGPSPVKSVRPVETTKAVEPIKSTASAKPAVPAEPIKYAKPPVPAEPTVAPFQPVAAPSRLFPGYALQVGVFADPRRAEELHARLTQEGIPSFIEARVEVGPFKTRDEADAARAKLNVMGIESVLLSPKGAKR